MSGNLIERIVAAIAEAEDREPDELEMALQNHIPTDAIRDLERHRSDSWRLEFETKNHVVEVVGNEAVVVDGRGRKAVC